MQVFAFVGSSGTGKSHRAIAVAHKYNMDAIVDDGLLIAENKVLAGVSAKREPTRLASVRRALFLDAAHAKEVRAAILKHKINRILILGTSDGMVDRIAQTLGLPAVSEYIRIETEATPAEIALAQQMRKQEGQHVIPVPAFEIKKDFSGYFLHPLRLFRRSLDSGEMEPEEDKTIVRPTFSYLGAYTVSDQVIAQLVRHAAGKHSAMGRIYSVDIRNTAHGAHIDVVLQLRYGCHIPTVAKTVQRMIADEVEQFSAINARRVHILVKNLLVEK